ncbi:MAG: ABC transporter ATP-binding protein [Candidatus Xenobium sp.]|jgi:ABC-type Fe3+/spermidine/putrescine transport system ATPase subunit|nr:ABC transporter ATP-binding protein [Burkholderiales bacterium]
MSHVEIRNLVKSFGSTLAVDRVSLDVGDGEFFSLLGASGCGKTTTLRCVAGLETPSGGEILLDGQDVAQVPAWDRNCGMVFQNYALFPHMTVADNVAYGLMARRYRQAGLLGRMGWLLRTVSACLPSEDMDRVREALAMVELEGLEERRPGQLSGGQQQRVALARALVIRPRVLLFDEPLGALDARLRVKMRQEIRSIQRRAGITTLYVTHDQEEALAVSDRIAVMNQGRVVQVGPPEELYLRPRTRFLADFIGLTNLFSARPEGPGRVRLLEGPVLPTTHAIPAQGAFSVAVRPESLRLLGAGEEAPGTFTGRVQLRMFMGSTVRYVVASGPLEWTVAAPLASIAEGVGMGDEVRVGLQPEDLMVLEDSE